MKDVHSVSLEHKDATFKDFLKAAFAYATFRPALARSHLRGEQWLFAKDAEGQKLFGMSGGANMTVFTANEEKPRDAEPPRHKGGLQL